MNSEHCQWSDFPPDLMQGAGVFRYGIAAVELVDPQAVELYHRWLEQGRHAAMDYLERYDDVRTRPALLLEGARSIICCAIPYYHRLHRAPGALRIASYAMGDDYHEVVRRRLEAVAARIRETFGGQTRVCVDTAPLRERYWAVKAGVGTIGLNNHLLIPGGGSYFFLGEILTTVSFTPSQPLSQNLCTGCGRCIKACPTRAIDGSGACDAVKCLSYLTIEHRGDFQPGTNLHGRFYGCDACAEACPLNQEPPPCPIEEFKPRQALLTLTREQMLAMSQPEFSALFSHSAMKRAKLAGLQRNAAALPSAPAQSTSAEPDCP